MDGTERCARGVGAADGACALLPALPACGPRSRQLAPAAATPPLRAQLQGDLQPDANEVVLTHLRSYEGMGRARVACESGCT